MNKSQLFNEDILSGYINPEKIEKTPAGFTQRTMMRLQSEKAPSVIMEKPIIKYRIPVFYAMITLVLIIVTLILLPSDNVNLDVPLIKNLGEISLPEINISKLFSFALPQILVYISLGVFVLLLFDQLLNRLFHRERK